MIEDIPSLQSSAWRILQSSYRDAAFLQEMGVDTKIFNILLQMFTEHESIRQSYTYAPIRRSRYRSGRRRKITPDDHLALILHYFRGRSTQTTIGRLFGITQPMVSKLLNEGVNVLVHQLRDAHIARIKWPDVNDMNHFAELAHARDSSPDVSGVFGFVDGLKLPVREPTDSLIQNMYWSGYTRRCEVTNVLLFTLDGCIAFANINNPGAVSDSEMAQGIYRRLQLLPQNLNFKIVADSAFQSVGLENRVLKPKTHQQPISSLAEGISHARITSLRQAVEWGMRSIQSVFVRLNAGLPLHNEKRGKYIELCLRLHNVNTRESLVCRNQIKTVFSPDYIPNVWNLSIQPHERLNQFYRLSEIVDFRARARALANSQIDHDGDESE